MPPGSCHPLTPLPCEAVGDEAACDGRRDCEWVVSFGEAHPERDPDWEPREDEAPEEYPRPEEGHCVQRTPELPCEEFELGQECRLRPDCVFIPEWELHDRGADGYEEKRADEGQAFDEEMQDEPWEPGVCLSRDCFQRSRQVCELDGRCRHPEENIASSGGPEAGMSRWECVPPPELPAECSARSVDTCLADGRCVVVQEETCWDDADSDGWCESIPVCQEPGAVGPVPCGDEGQCPEGTVCHECPPFPGCDDCAACGPPICVQEDACAGVVCDEGLTCEQGACVDPAASVRLQVRSTMCADPWLQRCNLMLETPTGCIASFLEGTHGVRILSLILIDTGERPMADSDCDCDCYSGWLVEVTTDARGARILEEQAGFERI